MATYSKLRNGSWGVRVEGSVSPGQSVTVTTKAGKTKTETVGKVIWQGSGVSLCSIEERGSSRGTDSYGNRIGNGDSYRAGVTAPHGRTCPMCGRRDCARAWDSRDLCDED